MPKTGLVAHFSFESHSKPGACGVGWNSESMYGMQGASWGCALWIDPCATTVLPCSQSMPFQISKPISVPTKVYQYLVTPRSLEYFQMQRASIV